MPAKPIPAGYHSVQPYLLTDNAESLLNFVTNVFGAEEMMRVAGDDGRVTHAEVHLGDSVVMIGQPGDGKAMSAALYVYLDDVDATYKRALAPGAESTEEPADQFYGDRRAGVRDPSGNIWWIATNLKEAE